MGIFIMFVFLLLSVQAIGAEEGLVALAAMGFLPRGLRGIIDGAVVAKATLAQEIRRLRENEEVVLWHITPSALAAEDIFRNGFAPPRHEGGFALAAPWLPKWTLGQRGEDRVSCGVPGLWMLPWMIMKAAISESGPMLEIRIPRSVLEESGTVARTHVALGTVDGKRIEFPMLTSIEVNVDRAVMNDLIKQGRVRIREDIEQMELKEWMKLTINGEQGLFGQAQRTRREVQEKVKEYAGLFILHSVLQNARPILEDREAMPRILRRVMRANLSVMRWWALRRKEGLCPEPECSEAIMQEVERLLLLPVGWLEEAAADGVEAGAAPRAQPGPEFKFDIKIDLPSLNFRG